MNIHDPEFESKAEKLLARLKAKNPKFDLMAELGTMMMRHIDSFTPAERKRYDELLELCKD